MTPAPLHFTAAVTDFLNRALADGALAVADLEARARAAGLLGEHQQIQHAKPFKLAKKGLDIRSIRDGFGRGGKWAWMLPPQPMRHPTSTPTAGAANAQANVCVADDTESTPQNLSLGRVPASWAEGIARLEDRPRPPDIPSPWWHLFLADCHSFMNSSENWPERAVTLGWDAIALFGCRRTRPLEYLGSAGLLWAVNGGKLVELRRDGAVIERRQDKSRQVYHRRRQDGVHVTLPWIGFGVRACP